MIKQSGESLSGESLREREIMSEDRISDLPQALIQQILSLLPTKLVIATSVLSKQWQSLWKMVPKLEFESDDKKFAENFTKSLFSHKAPVLESLKLKVSNKCDDLDVEVERWAGIATARKVREFVLNTCLSFGTVTLPSSLLCSDTLEILKLNIWIYNIVPSPVSLKSLRTLHLRYVTHKDDESFCNLLFGCPNLEDLLLHRYNPNYAPNFVIVSPSLKRLSIGDYNITREENGGYVINAPCLKYLHIESLKGHEFCLIEKVPMLVEAKIRTVSHTVNEKINMGFLTSAKRLFLDLTPLEIKYPSGSIFYQLVSLEMCTHKANWWNLLALMLDRSPKLQVLKLIDQYNRYKRVGMVGRKWNKPKCVPECLLSHLETFVWTTYFWESEQEQEVATYILRSARCLKNATFSTRPIDSKDLDMLEKRSKMLNELDGVVKASKSSCNLVFQ